MVLDHLRQFTEKTCLERFQQSGNECKRLPGISPSCLKGFMSGHRDGYSIRNRISHSKYWLIMRTLKTRALSFIKAEWAPIVARNGRTHYARVSSLYHTTVTVPRGKIIVATDSNPGSNHQTIASVSLQFVDVARLIYGSFSLDEFQGSFKSSVMCL